MILKLISNCCCRHFANVIVLIAERGRESERAYVFTVQRYYRKHSILLTNVCVNPGCHLDSHQYSFGAEIRCHRLSYQFNSCGFLITSSNFACSIKKTKIKINANDWLTINCVKFVQSANSSLISFLFVEFAVLFYKSHALKNLLCICGRPRATKKQLNFIENWGKS